jgi:hypothetical protein
MNQDSKLIKMLETLEKRASTLKANAKTFTQVGRANALQANARILRASLKSQGIIQG